MSEGCINCLVKDKDRALETTLKEAQKDAEATKKPIAIYYEESQWKRINAFEAARLGIPFTRVVSVNY